MKNAYLTFAVLTAIFASCKPQNQVEDPVKQEEPEIVISATADFIKDHNGHGYVDLGLPSKTLWATMNVGAEKPEAAGNFYAWGELEPKEEYTEANYFDITNPTRAEGEAAIYKKYKEATQTLEDADDVAAQKWKGNWRIPTEEQFTELRQNCYWQWKNKGLKGYFVFKAKDEKHKGQISNYEIKPLYDAATDPYIFIPSSGFMNNKSVGYKNEVGYYWTRSLVNVNNARFFNVLGTRAGWEYTDTRPRFQGRSVRAVCTL